MSLKQQIKHYLVNLFRTVMPLIQSIPLQNFLLKSLYRKLLDPNVVPDKFVPCKLWNLPGKILVNPHEFNHWRPYWFRRLNEIHIDQYMRLNLVSGDTFIDVGCNCGHHTILAACLVDQTGQVIAFEPNPDLTTLVQTQLAEQALTHVTLYPVGLADQANVATLNIKGRVGALSQVKFQDNLPKQDSGNRIENKVQCDIRTGDDMIPMDKLKGRILLKVDVEGLEFEVLSGMRSLLAQCIDAAIVEVTQLNSQEKIAALFALMHELGFQGHQMLDSGYPGTVMSAADATQHMDVLFVKCR